jgi:GNAT superfamily N-acetyltransferase
VENHFPFSWQSIMTDAQDFHINDPDYVVSRLLPSHAEALQRLFEQCADYVMIVDGEGVSPSAAQETFESVPPGIPLSDKFVYGLFDRAGGLVGMLDVVRGYPDESTWWIGLLMLAPEVRGRGLGRKWVAGFLEYARSEGGKAVMLGVVEENTAAYRFWQGMGFELVRQTEPRTFGKKIQTVFVMQRGVTQESMGRKE